MRDICAECGAPVPEGPRCESRFDLLQAREWEVYQALGSALQPEHGEIAHFLAVGAYVLQHPDSMQYTVASLDTLREMVALRLKQEASTHHLRHTARAARKSGLVRRRAGDPVPSWGVHRWPMTIADVDGVPPADYIAAVHAWALSVTRAIDEVHPPPNR